MAQNSIAEEIADLETRVKLLDDKIKQQQHLGEIEEGGGSGRFRTDFADIGKLYKRRDELNTRLQTLYRGNA